MRLGQLEWDASGRMLMAVESNWTAHVWLIGDDLIHLITWRFSGSPTWDGEALVGPSGGSLVRVSLPLDPVAVLSARKPPCLRAVDVVRVLGDTPAEAEREERACRARAPIR